MSGVAHMTCACFSAIAVQYAHIMCSRSYLTASTDAPGTTTREATDAPDGTITEAPGTTTDAPETTQAAAATTTTTEIVTTTRGRCCPGAACGAGHGRAVRGRVRPAHGAPHVLPHDEVQLKDLPDLQGRRLHEIPRPTT